ncbi:bluetail domain-containing putative surface protein [Nostoc sp.]|uniref:bluetail domain-containing putative surface protein n=1 Tax=Nostoc sp. TaxID=1180 RepID=UPI003FA5843B
MVKAAATFTLSKGTDQQNFLAVNDNTNGFSSLTDAVIEISRYKGNLAKFFIKIVSNRAYFVASI